MSRFGLTGGRAFTKPRFVLALVLGWVMYCGALAPVTAQSFGVGLNLTGQGDFGTGLFSTGIPGQIGGELRLERLNLFALGVSLRLDIGFSGLDAMVFWRADLSQSVYLTLGAGAALIDYAAPGVVARVGLEYRFAAFGVCLEYGWRSSFETASPALRSQWALGFTLFL